MDITYIFRWKGFCPRNLPKLRLVPESDRSTYITNKSSNSHVASRCGWFFCKCLTNLMLFFLIIHSFQSRIASASSSHEHPSYSDSVHADRSNLHTIVYHVLYIIVLSSLPTTLTSISPKIYALFFNILGCISYLWHIVNSRRNDRHLIDDFDPI